MKPILCDEFYYYVENNNLKIENVFNTCKENIFRNNNNIPQYEGEWIKIKVNKFKTHFVKPAESLKDIAKKYSINEDKIMKDNNLNETKIFVGQMLKIME